MVGSARVSSASSSSDRSASICSYRIGLPEEARPARVRSPRLHVLVDRAHDLGVEVEAQVVAGGEIREPRVSDADVAAVDLVDDRVQHRVRRLEARKVGAGVEPALEPIVAFATTGAISATADSSDASASCRLLLRLERPMGGRFQLEGMPTYRRVSGSPLPIPGRGVQGSTQQRLGGASGRWDGSPEQVVERYLAHGRGGPTGRPNRGDRSGTRTERPRPGPLRAAPGPDRTARRSGGARPPARRGRAPLRPRGSPT